MANQSTTIAQSRCRLVLVISASELALMASENPQKTEAVFVAGDIASIIFGVGSADPSAFQSELNKIIPLAQAHDIACIVENDSQIAGRTGADGLHMGQDMVAIKEAMEKHSSSMMIGAGNVKSRHNALTIGELQPDYLMFGIPGGDIRDDPHPKNLALGEWWSSMIEIPCIVMGGRLLNSVIPVAQCGAEFVALGHAIFSPDDTGIVNWEEVAERVKEANNLLDQYAPSFEESDV